MERENKKPYPPAQFIQYFLVKWMVFRYYLIKEDFND